MSGSAAMQQVLGRVLPTCGTGEDVVVMLRPAGAGMRESACFADPAGPCVSIHLRGGEFVDFALGAGKTAAGLVPGPESHLAFQRGALHRLGYYPHSTPGSRIHAATNRGIW